MKILPTPTMTLSDADVTATLGNAVRIIDPLLDVLWGTDPIGLKRRTPDFDGGPLDKVADGLSWNVQVPASESDDQLAASVTRRLKAGFGPSGLVVPRP